MLLEGAQGGGRGAWSESGRPGTPLPLQRLVWGWVGRDMRHSLREEQEPGCRYNVGFQSQTQTYCSELEDPKGQAGAQCKREGHWDPRQGGPCASPKLDTVLPPCGHLTPELSFLTCTSKWRCPDLGPAVKDTPSPLVHKGTSVTTALCWQHALPTGRRAPFSGPDSPDHSRMDRAHDQHQGQLPGS